MISDTKKVELLHMKKDDLSISFLAKNFGKTCRRTENGMELVNPPFDTMDELVLEAGEFINKEKTETTVGSILWNKLFVEGRFEPYIENSFYNCELTKKTFGKFVNTLMPHFRQKRISIETWIEFLKDYEFYGLNACFIFSPSYTMNIIEPQKEVMDMKEDLIANAKDKNDVIELVHIEDTLTDKAKEILKDDSGFPIYASGARGSFENDYKNISVSLGVTQNLVTGEFEFVKNNYIDGLQKEDIVAMGNTLVASEYPKAVGTADAGYLTKKFYSLFQDIVADEPGTDCHSTSGITVFLTKENVDSYLYQNIITPKGLVNLHDDNKDEWIGKKVVLRSPMYCHNANGKKCAACMGTRYYDLEIENAGLTTGKISNDLLNKGMKFRHSMKQNLYEIDPSKMLLRRG